MEEEITVNPYDASITLIPRPAKAIKRRELHTNISHKHRGNDSKF